MVMPLPSREAALRIAGRLRVALPAETLARFDAGEDGGLAVFAETVRALSAGGLADGLSVMTSSADPAPGGGRPDRRRAQRSRPAIHPVMSVARVPAAIERSPRRARS